MTRTPVWRGVVTDGRLRLETPDLFKAFLRRWQGPVTLTLKRPCRPKSAQQLGYLFGVVYPVIADELGYREYEIDQVHDAVMRELRGQLPEPNPLRLRVSMAAMPHEDVSRYIDDVRHWAVTTFGIVTPDPDRVDTHEGGRT